MSFFSSFTYMLLHSLWQSALILIIYAAVNLFVKNIHPLQKRNFLYVLITAQLAVSNVTFFLCFTNNNLFTVSSLTIYTKLTFLPDLSVWENYADTIIYSYFAIIGIRALAVWNQCRNFKIKCTRDLIKPSPELKVFTDLKAYQLGIKKKVILRYSRCISSPLTFGFIKPFILLPFSVVNRLSFAEVESILLHELAHIKNHDYLLNWIVVFAENIYFFNPFLKILIKKLKVEREKNCDVQVLNFNYSPIGYAETLLKIAKLKTGTQDFQLAAVGSKTELLQRIRFFSREQNLIFNKNHSKSLVFLSIVFFLFANLLILTLFDKSKKVSESIGSDIASTHAAEKTIENSKQTALRSSSYQKEVFTVTYKRENKNSDIHLIQSPKEEISTPAGPDFIPTAVSYNLTPDSSKEFIYNEETQDGNITQSYKLVLVNGNWIIQPQWMILETKPDSSHKVFSDTLQLSMPL